MGYYTTLSGGIFFSSEPTYDVWELTKNLDFLYWLEEDEPQTYIDFDDSESAKYYRIYEEVETLISLLAATGIVVNGEIIGVGEEMPDIWRIKINDNIITRENVKIIWPDGTEYK